MMDGGTSGAGSNGEATSSSNPALAPGSIHPPGTILPPSVPAVGYVANDVPSSYGGDQGPNGGGYGHFYGPSQGYGPGYEPNEHQNSAPIVSSSPQAIPNQIIPVIAPVGPLSPIGRTSVSPAISPIKFKEEADKSKVEDEDEEEENDDDEIDDESEDDKVQNTVAIETDSKINIDNHKPQLIHNEALTRKIFEPQHIPTINRRR